MESLHAPCTPLKKAYDACFNHWFEEYLAVAAPKPGSQPQSTLPLSSATPQASTSASTSPQTSIAIASEGLSHQNVNPVEAEARQVKIRAKAEEYEKKCGDTWRAYRTCLEVGIGFIHYNLVCCTLILTFCYLQTICRPVYTKKT